MVLANFNLPYPLWTFANFDGVHYIRIAQDGYEQKFTQAFFPMYPILIKLFSFIALDNLLVSSLILSNAAFLAGLILFYRMVCKIYDKKNLFFLDYYFFSRARGGVGSGPEQFESRRCRADLKQYHGLFRRSDRFFGHADDFGSRFYVYYFKW